MNDSENERFIKKLKQDGLSKVKANLANGIYGNGQRHKSLAENWVKEQEQQSETDHKERVLSAQKAANEIAKDANKIARFSLKISCVALIISFLVAIFK